MINLGSESDTANPYVWSAIGWGKQRGAVWWNKGWLFLARSKDDSDAERFLATYPSTVRVDHPSGFSEASGARCAGPRARVAG
jgi:hypothetical protein